jgi:hypothetical protein
LLARHALEVVETLASPTGWRATQSERAARDQYDEKVRSVIARDTIGPVSVDPTRFRSFKR